MATATGIQETISHKIGENKGLSVVKFETAAVGLKFMEADQNSSKEFDILRTDYSKETTCLKENVSLGEQSQSMLSVEMYTTESDSSDKLLEAKDRWNSISEAKQSTTEPQEHGIDKEKIVLVVTEGEVGVKDENFNNSALQDIASSELTSIEEPMKSETQMPNTVADEAEDAKCNTSRTQYSSAIYGFSKQAPECASFKNENVENLDSNNSFELPSNEKNTETDKTSSNEVGRTTDHMKKDNGDVSNEQHTVQLDTFHKAGNGQETESEFADIESLQEAASKVEDKDKLELDVEKSKLEEAESISGNLNLQPEEQNRGTDETTLQDEAAEFRKPDIDCLTAEETEIVTNKLMLIKNEIQVDPHEKVTDLAEMKEDSTTDSPKNTESHDDASAFQISVYGAEVDKGDAETTKQSGEKAMAKENIIRDNLTEDVSSAMLKAENKLLQESEIAILTFKTTSEERIHAHSVDKENKSDVIPLVQHKEEEDHNEKAQTKINNKNPVATDAAPEDQDQVIRNEENTNLHDTMYHESGEEINEPIILTSEARDLDGLLKDNSNVERSHESHYVSHPKEASSAKKEVDAKLEEVMEMRTVDAKVNDFKGSLETTKEKHHETSYIDHEDVPHQNTIDQVEEVQNGKPTLAVAQTQSEERLEREGSNELIMQEKLQQFGDFNSNKSVSTNVKAQQIETEMPKDESSDKMLDALNSAEASAQENMQGAPASVEEESAKDEENRSTKRDEIEGISVQRSPEYAPVEEEIAKADENGSTTKEETGGMKVERSPHLYPKGNVSEASESSEHCKKGLLNEEMDGDTKEKNAESVQHPEENLGNRAWSEILNETAYQLEPQEREEVSTASEMTNICYSNEKEQAKIDERVKEGVPQLEPEDHNFGRNDADGIDEDSTIENPNPDNPTEEEDTDRKEVKKRDEIIENVPLTPVSVEETMQNIDQKHEETSRSVPQEQFQDITRTKETTTHSDTPEVSAPEMVDMASIPDLEEQRNIQINEAKKGKIEISEEVYPSEAVVSMYQKNEVGEDKESIIKETHTEAPPEDLESILQAKLTEAVRQAEVSQLDMPDKTVNKTKTIGITNNTKKESKLALDKKEEKQPEDLPNVMPDGLEADAANESIEQQKKDVGKIATAQAEGETGRKSEDSKLENDAAAIVVECHFREHSTKDTKANEDLNEKDLEPVHHSEEVMTPDTHEENNSSNSLEALQDIPAPIEVSTEPVEKNTIEASSPASEEQLQETIHTDQNAFSNDPKETIESEILISEPEAALEEQRNEPIAESGNGKTQRQEEEKWENSVSDLSTSTSAERRPQKEGKKALPADNEVPMHRISGATESKESMILEEEKATALDTSGVTLPSNFTKCEQLTESYGLHRQDTSEGKENQLESMDYKEAESSITESPRDEEKDKQPKGETNNQDMELEIDGPFKDILVPIVQEKVAAMTPDNTNVGIETERAIVDKNEATELKNRIPEVTAEYQTLEVKDIMDKEVSNEVVSLEIEAIETVNENLKPVDPNKNVDTMDSEDQNIKHNKNGDLHGNLTSVEEAFQEQAEKNKEASSFAEVHVHEVITADNEAAYETVAETGKGTTEIREEEKNLDQTVDNLSTSNSAYGSIEKEDEEAHPPEVEVLMQQASRETEIKESLIFYAEKPIAVDVPEEKKKEASGFPKEHVHGAINADTETVAETGNGITEGVLEEKNLDKTVDNLFNSNSAYISINKEEEAHPQVKVLMNQSSEATEIKESVILNEEKSTALDIQEVNNEEASGFAEEHVREFVHIDNETIPGTEIQEEEESSHKMVDDLFTTNSASESIQKEEESHLPEAVILMQQTSEAMEIKENVILNEEKVTALDIPKEKNKEASGFAEVHVHGAINADKDTVAETGNDTTEVKEEKNLDNTVDDLANSNSAYGNIHEEETHPPEFEIFMHQTSEAVGIKESVILSERQSISMDTPEVKNKEASGFAEEYVQETVCIDNENIPERGGKTEIQKEENLDKTVDDLSTAYKGIQKEEEEAHPSELDLLMHQTSEATEIIKESVTLHEKKVTALDTPEEKNEEAPGFAKERVHGILHSDKETVSETVNNQTEVGEEEENLDKTVDDWSHSNSVYGSIQDKEEEAHPSEFEVPVHQIVEAREIKESVTLNEKQSTALDILEVKNEEASGFAKEYVHEAVHIDNETIPETRTGKTVIQKEVDDLDKTVDELSTSDSAYSSILKEEEEAHPPEVEILMNQTSEETEIKETVILNEEKLTALDILEEKNKEASGFAKEHVHGSINADKEIVAETGNSTTKVREEDESLDKIADDLSTNSAYGSIHKEEEEVHPPEVEVLVYQTTEATEIKKNIILNEEKSPVLDAPEPTLPSNFSKGEQLAESHGLDMQDEPEDTENKLEARENIEEENSHMDSSEEEVKRKYPKDPSNNKVIELQIDTPFHCIIEPNTEEVADMTPCNMGVKIETDREIMDKNEAVEPESRTQELIALPQTHEGDDNRGDEVSTEVVSSQLEANGEMHKVSTEIKAIEAICKDLKVVGASKKFDKVDLEDPQIKDDNIDDCHGTPTVEETVQEPEEKNREGSDSAEEHVHKVLHADNNTLSDAPKEHIDSMALVRPSEPDPGNEIMANTKDSKTEISLQNDQLGETLGHLSTSLTSANENKQRGEEASFVDAGDHLFETIEVTKSQENMVLEEEERTQESSESNLSTSSPEYEQIEEIHSLATRYKSVNIHIAENEISCTDLPAKEVHHTEEPDTDGPSEDIKNPNQEEVGTEKKQAIIEGEMVDQSSKEDSDEGIKPEKLEPDAEEKEYLETDSVKDEVSKGTRAEGEVEINEKLKTTEKRNFEKLDTKSIKSEVAEKSSQEGNIEERIEGEAFQVNSEDQCCKERNTIQNTESEKNEEVKPSNFKSEGQDFEQISTNGVDPHRTGDCTVDAGISAEERKQEQEDDKNQEIPNFVAAELNQGAIEGESETEPEETQRYSEQVPLPEAIADEMSSVIAIAEDTSSMDKTVPHLPDSHISMEKYFQKGVTESIEAVSTTKEVNEDKGTSVIEQEDYRNRTIPGSSIETNFFVLDEHARSCQNKPETVSEKCGESQNIEEAMATNGAENTDDLIEEYQREKKSEELHATLGSEAVKDKLNLTMQPEKYSTECEEFEGGSQREPGKKQKKITSEFNLEVQGDGRKEELSEVPKVVDTENIEEQKSEDDEMLDRGFLRVKEENKFEEVQPSDLPSKEQDIKSVASSTDKTETSTFSNEENQSNVGEASPHTTNSTDGGIKEEASGKQGEPTELAAKGNIMEITCLKGETSPDKPKRDTQIIYKPEQSLKDEKNLNKVAAIKLEPEQQMHETNEVSQTTEVVNVLEVIEKKIEMSGTEYVVEKIKETEKSTNEPEITPIGEKIELTSMTNESAKLDEEAPKLNVQYQIFEKYSSINTTESENPEEERIADEKTTEDLEIASTKNKEIEVGDKGKWPEEESLEEEVNNKVFNSRSMLSEQNNETLGNSTKETMYVEDEELPNERFNAPAIAGVLAKESKEEVCGEVAQRPDLFNMTNTVKMISEENNPEFAITETTTQEGPNEEEKLQSTQADPVFVHEEVAISDITEEIKQKEDRNSTTEISSTRGHVLHLMPEELFDQTITTSKKYPVQTMVEEVENKQNWIVEEHKTRQVQYVEPESMEKAEDDPNQKHKAFEPNKVQFSDPLKVSARDTIVKAKNFKEENSPEHQHDEFESKIAANVDTEDVNMHNVKDEKGKEDEEHKSSDVQVIVKASGETGPKPSPKKSHNILSGVGSKVKHSIAKVKKAITGKSSHTKTVSPK